MTDWVIRGHGIGSAQYIKHSNQQHSLCMPENTEPVINAVKDQLINTLQ